FKMTPNGVMTTLLDFANTTTGDDRGAFPLGGLVKGSDGNLYGTTPGGGAYASGTIFKVASNGTVTTFFDFAGDAGVPTTSLIMASDGNLYGTTNGADVGSVYRLVFPGAPAVY